MSWNKGIEYLIRRDFGSTADFALALQDTVRDMPTSGYVWLVQELLGHEHKLALKTTLGSGTILIPARQQGEQSMAFEEEEVMALPELPEERPTGEPGGKNRPDVVEKPWEATPSEEVSTFVPPFSSEFDSGRPSRPDDIPNPSFPLLVPPPPPRRSLHLSRPPHHHPRPTPPATSGVKSFNPSLASPSTSASISKTTASAERRSTRGPGWRPLTGTRSG
jgi:hypothetical protein